MKQILSAATVVVLSLGLLVGCGGSGNGGDRHGHDHENGAHSHENEEHAHENGENEEHEHTEEGGHAHKEYDLGTFDINGMEIEAAQGGKEIKPGKEGHLVIKLPYSDEGSTIVRAWIGTEDRTRSIVGKGTYAPTHDDYDIRTMAPDPIPENAKWWVEIEKPDGSKTVGSIPLYKDVAEKKQ